MTVETTTPRICLVTDRRRLAGVADDRERLDALVGIVERAARAGVDLIQIRERDLPARALVDLTRRAVRACRDTRARVVVNDRVDVALAAQAHGVHLRADSPPAGRVRAVAPEGWLVGRSVHSETEAVEVAAAGGVDYLVAGPVFATRSKAAGHPTLGVEALARIVARVRVPVLAIGGLTLATIPAVVAVGAGVAAIGVFLGEPGGDPEEAVARVVGQIRECFERQSGTDVPRA